jgi:hypothetical protein
MSTEIPNRPPAGCSPNEHLRARRLRVRAKSLERIHNAPWRSASLPNYSVIKSAKAAARALDEKWLASTACVLAPEGWRVALIDAPINRYDFKMIWHGRAFPTGSSDAVDVYFDQNDVATAALFDDFFPTHDAAVHWAATNLNQGADVYKFPYEVLRSTKGFRISIGPASWLSLTQFCESRKANSRCWVIGQPPN